MANRHELLNTYRPWGLAWDVGIDLPKSGTASARTFFGTWAKTNSLMAFVFDTTARFARLTETITSALDKVDANRPKPPSGRRLDIWKRLGAHTQLLWEMLLCRHVDNFTSYLSSILFEAFVARPQMLNSRDATIDVSVVLSQPTIRDLINVIAERKVNALSYKSFSDLCEYFAKQGLPIGADNDRLRISQAVEIRNISVHNGCVVNERFLAAVPETPRDELGQVRLLNIHDVEPLAIVLGDLVRGLDESAIPHFGLSTSTWEIDPWKHESMGTDDHSRPGS